MICVLVSTESEDEAAKVHLSICWASVRTRGLPLGSGALEGSGSGPGAPAPAQPGPLASDTGTGEEEQDCRLVSDEALETFPGVTWRPESYRIV